MNLKVVVTVGGDDDQATLSVDVEGDDADFLTVLGAMEAAKIQYVQSKYLGPSADESQVMP